MSPARSSVTCATCGAQARRGNIYCSELCQQTLAPALRPVKDLLDQDENGEVVLRARTRILLRWVVNWVERGGHLSAGAAVQLAASLNEAEAAEERLAEMAAAGRSKLAAATRRKRPS